MVNVPCARRRKGFLCLVTGVCYTPVTTPRDRLCFSARKKPSSRPARFCSPVTPPVTLSVTHWLTAKTRMNPRVFGFCDHVTYFYKKKETAKGGAGMPGKFFAPGHRFRSHRARCAGKSELFMKPLDFWCAAVYISTRKL